MEQRLQQLTFGKSLLAGTVLSLLYFFLMYNNGATLEASIATGKNDIVTKEEQLAKIKGAVADAARYQNTKNALGAELDSVLKAIPAQLTAQDLMKIVSNEAKAIGVNLNISPAMAVNNDPNKKDRFFEPVSVSLSLDGNYNQLMTFLSAVTKVDKIITLSSLNLATLGQRNPDDNSPLTLKLTAEMRAYRYLPSAAPKEAN